MPRLFVVEGPDGAGKSTLLSRLEKDLNRVAIHTGGPPVDRVGWLNRMAIVWGAFGRRAILDRIPHISEPVYRKLDGGKTYDAIDFLNRELKDLNPVIVYCRLPGVQAMMDCISMKPKDHKPPEHMAKVLAMFPFLVAEYDRRISEVQSLGIYVITYSWIDHDYNHLLEKLKCADLF